MWGFTSRLALCRARRDFTLFSFGLDWRRRRQAIRCHLPLARTREPFFAYSIYARLIGMALTLALVLLWRGMPLPGRCWPRKVGWSGCIVRRRACLTALPSPRPDCSSIPPQPFMAALGGLTLSKLRPPIDACA